MLRRWPRLVASRWKKKRGNANTHFQTRWKFPHSQKKPATASWLREQFCSTVRPECWRSTEFRSSLNWAAPSFFCAITTSPESSARSATHWDALASTSRLSHLADEKQRAARKPYRWCAWTVRWTIRSSAKFARSKPSPKPAFSDWKINAPETVYNFATTY